MDKDKHTASQQVFSEVRMKAIAAIVGDLLEEELKNHVGMLQLEKGGRSTLHSISGKK